MIFLENNIDKTPWFLKSYLSYTYVRVFLYLALGIICGNYLSSDFVYYALFGIATVVILLNTIISTLCKNPFKEWIFIFSFIILIFSLGATLMISRNDNIQVNVPSEHSSYLIKVTSIPHIKNNYCTFDAVVIHAFDSVFADLQNHKVLLKEVVDSQFVIPKIGDSYIINTSFYLPKNNIASFFDYGEYLIINGYSKIGYIYDDIILENETDSYSLFEKILFFRDKLISTFKSLNIHDEELSILSAITLGDKSLLSDDTKSNFSAAGVSHILVVSGMHVGFIFMFISLLYNKFYNRFFRGIVTVSGIVILWLYALLTGFAPSVIRASLMFSLMLLFKYLGNKYRVIHALFFSAVISLLCNPALLFNISFQLSYLAVLSIVLFYKKLYHFFIDNIPSFKGRNNIFSVISVTLAAQILTCPIVMYSFHQFPLFFIITNLFVVLLAPTIFIGGFILLITSFIPYVSSLFAYVLNLLLSFFCVIIDRISSLKYAVTDVYITFFECILLYVFILLIINYLYCSKQSKIYSLYGVFASILMFIGMITYNTLDSRNMDVLYISNKMSLMVNVFNGNSNYLYINENNHYVNLDIWLKYNAPEPIVISDSLLCNNIFLFDNQSYCILRDNVFRYKTLDEGPLFVDNLIIDRGVYPTPKLFEKFICPKNVILTNGVYKGYIDKYKEIFNEKGISYYSIAESGEYFKIKK